MIVHKVAVRTSLDPELVPLFKALMGRVDALPSVQREQKERLEVFQHDGNPFMQLEKKRDHMYLDLWLPYELIEEAKGSGLGRAHPFLGKDVVKIRFERAQDLTKVARWVEASHRFAIKKDAS